MNWMKTIPVFNQAQSGWTFGTRPVCLSFCTKVNFSVPYCIIWSCDNHISNYFSLASSGNNLLFIGPFNFRVSAMEYLNCFKLYTFDVPPPSISPFSLLYKSHALFMPMSAFVQILRDTTTCQRIIVFYYCWTGVSSFTFLDFVKPFTVSKDVLTRMVVVPFYDINFVSVITYTRKWPT